VEVVVRETLMITEPWYAGIAERYGEEYCRIAGYFDETKPWSVPYGSVFDLPKGKIVLQYSGAFHPFHEGHLQAIQDAQAATRTFWSWRDEERMVVVVHADHSEYRNSKGHCLDEDVEAGFDLLKNLNVPYVIIREDAMPDGCSRNFTRLWRELNDLHNDVWFVAGGDRANYALTFRDGGNCIISGRQNSEMAKKWRFLSYQYERRIRFVGGHNPTSSTEIRARLAEER
jgi:hypothetical protein